MTRVALDARCTRQMSAGMQRYARELAARLPRVAPEFAFEIVERGTNFGWSEQVALPLAFARANVALVHFLAHYVPLALPSRFVITVHDLIHLHYPEQFKRRVGPYYRLVVRRACANAVAVVTDDERTVPDLERFLGVDPRKIRVIPLGVSAAPSIGEPQTGRPYLLNVGNHRMHKNLQRLLDAWQSLPAEYEIDLCFTGPDDFSGALQRASTNRRQARALGDLGEAELGTVYANARALVHPALREGFGLPLLEAMARGVPVLAASDAVASVLASAVLTFDAADVRSLAQCIVNILQDEGLRARLVKAGRMLATAFTWDRCARETAALYHDVLR
ncbi:MAG: glycosyltransferase family 4 protein [Candidatus Tyrphobacter sp.]